MLIAICTFTLTSCSDDTSVSEAHESDLYLNSFESDNDFLDFELGVLHKEAPEDGGEQSIAISGGCIWPHTITEVGPFDSDKNVIVSVVARIDANFPKSSTTLESFIGPNYESSEVLSIQTTDWKTYATPVFYLQKGESLFITLNSGGMMAGLAYFDLLRVEEVE